jgi:hypothetical protein
MACVEAIALAFETFREEHRQASEGSEAMAGQILIEQKEIRSQMAHLPLRTTATPQMRQPLLPRCCLW